MGNKVVVAPVCPYCRSRSQLVYGNIIYPYRKDLHSLKFYQCAPCDAYVGCHRNSGVPLGRLANAQLRTAKMSAHTAFDPIWKTGLMTRSGAYAWLAKMMRMNPEDCHIGMFDVDQCKLVVYHSKVFRGVND